MQGKGEGTLYAASFQKEKTAANLQGEDVPCRVVVGALPQPVVAPQAVDVPREGGEIRACEGRGARAHDGLDHPVLVGVHALEHPCEERREE